ncbi:pro-resilin-like [Macrobrachium rosenbergii]|uniref:pro-resilin-like n=1 Tax=Macrobrachium rosenbergii TaxID=79674 RepID=UPI0034D43C27
MEMKALFLAAILAVAAAESPRSYGPPPPPPSQSYGTPNGFNNGNGRFALFLAAILAVAAAESPRSYGPPPPSSQSYGRPNGFNNGNGRFPPARYDFEYEVKDRPSGNDFGHQESRRGDNTDGSYSVLLPDGRFQKVTYEVNGDSGFLAEVTYEGEARYPRPQASVSNGYQAPRSSSYD